MEYQSAVLDVLQSDILYEIVPYLGLQSLFKLSQTCKTLDERIDYIQYIEPAPNGFSISMSLETPIEPTFDMGRTDILKSISLGDRRIVYTDRSSRRVQDQDTYMFISTGYSITVRTYANSTLVIVRTPDGYMNLPMQLRAGTNKWQVILGRSNPIFRRDIPSNLNERLAEMQCWTRYCEQ